jgi:hypothetical protein
MSAKDTALEKANQGREALLDRWRAFREESPYFQAKVGLVAAWLIIAVLTVLIAPPAPIDFVVEQKQLSFGLAERTTLIIFNQAGGDLDTAVVEVYGTQTDFDGRKAAGKWRTKTIAIPQGLKTTLSTESFFDDKGINPGYQLQIDRVIILDDGDEQWQGPPGAPKK